MVAHDCTLRYCLVGLRAEMERKIQAVLAAGPRAHAEQGFQSVGQNMWRLTSLELQIPMIPEEQSKRNSQLRQMDGWQEARDHCKDLPI